jgi:hypothetical protein
MSSHKRQHNTLPPLQKVIILHLARTGPQTINKTAKETDHSYKPSWIAFNSLEEKGLVKKGKSSEYHGRLYPLYWLTELGILTALVERASPTELLAKAKEVYPNDQTLQYFLEMVPYFNIDVVRIAHTALRNKGKLEPADLGTIFFTQADTNTTFDILLKALATMRKYPKMYEPFKQQFSRLKRNFNKLAKVITAQEKE